MYYFGYTLAPGEERGRRGIPAKIWQGKGITCSGLIIAIATVELSVAALAIALWYWAGNQSATGYLSAVVGGAGQQLTGYPFFMRPAL